MWSNKRQYRNICFENLNLNVSDIFTYLGVHDVPVAQAHLADQRRVAQQLAATHEQAQHLGRQIAAPQQGQLR